MRYVVFAIVTFTGSILAQHTSGVVQAAVVGVLAALCYGVGLFSRD